MIKAIAAMLEAAKPGKKARLTPDEAKLAVSPRALYEAVRSKAGDKVLCDPPDGRWFGALGAILKTMPGFGPDDLEKLIAWLNAGGMAGWPLGVPTFGHLIKHFANWVPMAREWDRRGRQDLRRGGVGTATADGDNGLSAFKAPRLEP